MSNEKLSNMIADALKNNPLAIQAALDKAAAAPAAENKPAVPAAPPAAASVLAARDAKVLALVKLYATTEAKYIRDGVAPTMAVKVYGHLKQAYKAAFPDNSEAIVSARVNEMVEGAVTRNIVSRGFAKSSKFMLLYDAKQRPNRTFERNVPAAAEVAAVAALFA